MYHIFAARDDLLRISKASHKNPKITSVLKTLLIGQVSPFTSRSLCDNLPSLYIRYRTEVGGLTKGEPRCQPSPNEKLTQQSHNEPSPVFKEAGVGRGEAVEAAEEEGEGEEVEVDRKAEEEVGEDRRINMHNTRPNDSFLSSQKYHMPFPEPSFCRCTGSGTVLAADTKPASIQARGWGKDGECRARRSRSAVKVGVVEPCAEHQEVSCSGCGTE